MVGSDSKINKAMGKRFINGWHCTGCKYFEASIYDTEATQHCYNCKLVNGYPTEWKPMN